MSLETSPLTIADRTFDSRLILGTGKFDSPESMRDALASSGTQIVTVALRRADLTGTNDPFANILEFIDPERYLVTPRIIAMALSLPVLILYADAVGILGGCLALQLDPAIDISLALFWDNLVSEIAMQDIVVGLVKGVVFGVTIAADSCAFGLRTRGGTAGVASSTTQSVVWSFVLVIMFDFIIVRMAVLLP